MTDAGRNRAVLAPAHPGFAASTGRKRTDPELEYGYGIKREVIKKLYTLPYLEFVEVAEFAVNPSRLPSHGRYNNRGSSRDSAGNYQSYHDVTWLRSLVRDNWRKIHPDETIHVSWPEDDNGTRRVIWNADGQTVKMRFIRCPEKGCRKHHEGEL